MKAQVLLIVVFSFSFFGVEVSCRQSNKNPNSIERFLRKFEKHEDTKPLLEPAFHIESKQRSGAWENIAVELIKNISSYALFAMAFRLVTRSIASSWNQAVTEINSMKGAGSNLSPNITQYLKPNTTLNSYEEEILATITIPSSIDSSMKDIGGLYAVKESLLDVFVPDTGYERSGGATEDVRGMDISRLLRNNPLYQPVKSVLLYGPPGCGKSMLARALCKRLNVPMLNIVPSLLLRMYVGETSQLTKALFTLSTKLQPCLMFIDEMDSLFCTRMSTDGVVDRKLITEFMQLWDDLQREHHNVFIVGATNRPHELDPAVQRRFERSYLISPPDLAARKDIFHKVLKGVQLDRDFDFDLCASQTESYTPSDIAAVCKAAAFIPIQAALHRMRHLQEEGRKSKDRNQIDGEVRPMRTEDIMQALKHVRPTAWASTIYGQQQQQQQQQMYPPFGRNAGLNFPAGASQPTSADATTGNNDSIRNSGSNDSNFQSNGGNNQTHCMDDDEDDYDDEEDEEADYDDFDDFDDE